MVESVGNYHRNLAINPKPPVQVYTRINALRQAKQEYCCRTIVPRLREDPGFIIKLICRLAQVSFKDADVVIDGQY
jgi:hypothetical protein